MQERRAADKLTRAEDRVTIAQRRALLDKAQPADVLAGGGAIGRLVARADHHAHFVHTGVNGLLDNDSQHRLLHPVAINQALKRQGVLAAPSGCDHSFRDSHVMVSRMFAIRAHYTALDEWTGRYLSFGHSN